MPADRDGGGWFGAVNLTKTKEDSNGLYSILG